MTKTAAYLDSQALSPDALLVRHAPLVKRIAYHLLGRLPANVQADDLIQAGMIGLLDAARHYDASQGANFETYAGIRIRGAMLDEIRRNDWAPRSVHRKARDAARAAQQLANRLGREPEDYEIAQELEVSLNEYHEILADSNSAKVLSLHDSSEREDDAEHEPVDQSNPLEELQSQDFMRCLTLAIDALPQRERLVMSLYYDKELNLREIGQVLGVGESRVSQIHAQAVIRLQARLREWVNSGKK